MIFGYFTLFVALLIETVGAYYSITGLAAIFSGAIIPILVMGGSLELGKVVAAVWLKNNWHRASIQYKIYLLPAVAILMLITSMGIFGFLSKAHNDQNLVSGDVQSQIAIYDEKIKTEKENIEANRRALKQMDEGVDQVLGRSTTETGAERAVAMRKSQQKERSRLQNEISQSQKSIAELNDARAPIAAEVRKVEAEVGPIKYIAALIYGDNPDANILERAVSWVIIIIVAVFDPLALVLILAAQQSLRWAKEEDIPPVEVNKHTQTDVKNDPVGEPLSPEPEPIVEEKSIFERHPYLLKPFNHFTNTTPIVHKPEPEPVAEDQAAMNIVAEPEHVEIREFTEEEIQVLDQPVEEVQVVEPAPPPTPARVPEAAPGRNRGVMIRQEIQADNVPSLGKASTADFGTEFPKNPGKGDVYLRVDYLPNRLFKFNGDKWIEVDKTQTDMYAYNELYIKHLIDQIDAGSYDADTLTDIEREQISEYLKKNAQ
jgi:hypothetical protein